MRSPDVLCSKPTCRLLKAAVAKRSMSLSTITAVKKAFPDLSSRADG